MKKEKEENIWSKVEVQNGVEKGVKFKVEENIWSLEEKNNGGRKWGNICSVQERKKFD